MSVSLVIPAYSSGPPIERTIESVDGVCDETVIVSTAIFDQDNEALLQLTDKVVVLPWNFVFLNGFGKLYNMGSDASKNDWLLLFGVAETLAEQYRPIIDTVNHSEECRVFLCNHVNDVNQWKRVWNRRAAWWSGLIHEEIVGGTDGGLLFRMQDTPKESSGDKLRDETFRFIKAISYHHLYRELRLDNSKLGGTNEGWIGFVNGSKDHNEQFLREHEKMHEACLSGDSEKFISLVSSTISGGASASGVSFEPQGVDA